MLGGLSSLADLGKKKPDIPAPPATFSVKAPSMLPTWLPWALGIIGTGVVLYLVLQRSKKIQEVKR